MPNTQESGQRLRSKKRPRRTIRSGRGSQTNSNTSRQIPARLIDAGYDTNTLSLENLVRRHRRGAHDRKTCARKRQDAPNKIFTRAISVCVFSGLVTESVDNTRGRRPKGGTIWRKSSKPDL